MGPQQWSWLKLQVVVVVVLLYYSSFSNIFVSICKASPPIDYFVYTSQLATASIGAQNVSSFLLPIESIYKLTNDNNNRENQKIINDHQQHERRQQQQQQQQQHKQESESLKNLNNKLSARVLELVRNSSHRHDNDLIDLEATRYAWSLMEKQASLYMRNRVSTIKPFVNELLIEAQVSAQCQLAIGHWLDQLAELKQWAVLMWNSWGQFPPAGIYEGTYTDLGSYRGCININNDNSDANDDPIGQSQYCMLDFQPIVPTRPRFHSIFKRVLGLAAQSSSLNGGDFSNKHGDHLGSMHTAHEFASTRYNQLYGDNQKREKSSKNDLNWEKLAQHFSGNNNKTTSENQQQIEAANYNNNNNNNLTLKAEALIELAFKAQYFYYVKFRLGACLPSRCSKQDVQKLAQSASQRAILQSTQVNCMKKEPFSVNTYQLVAIWILSILAFIALMGTIVDLLGYKENKHNTSAFVNWLLPFSIWTNAQRLFDLETAGTHGDLECVHGLRFFSMIWVIYGHTILYMEYQSFTHFYDVIETQIPSFILLPSLNANFSVDTFFVISGILTTYVTWEYTKGDWRKFNKFAFMISRYIRLTPQLAIVILCFFLLPLFGDGPMYKQVADDKAQVCYKNWVINLFYLQSYINSEKLCIDPSWWLSIEMSFHVISVLVIVVMIKNVKQGMIVNFIIATLLTLWGSIIHYQNGFAIQYLPSIPQRFEVSLEQTKLFFHRPYPHAASYFIGIALGYVLANKTIKKLSKVQLIQGWLICALGFIISLWGSYYWNLGAPYNQLQATLYYNLCQILWPISIAWIILACSLGHGGYVDSILSARCFVPLGRVTYMTYLSHALIIYYHNGRMNITVEPSMLFFTYLFIANTTLSLSLGVILTVVYESPILNLQKQLFSYLTQKFDPTLRQQQQQHKLQNDSATEITITNEQPLLISSANAAAAAVLIANGNNNNNNDNTNKHHFSLDENYVTKNGFITQTPTANCLLLNRNFDKSLENHPNKQQQQQHLQAQEEEEEKEEIRGEEEREGENIISRNDNNHCNGLSR